MRDTVLYIATSLDGFIADTQGAIGWLGGERKEYAGDYGYQSFLETVDTVLLGGRTFRQITQQLSPDRWPYEGLCSIVFTRSPQRPMPGVAFTGEDPVKVVRELRAGEGKDLWICGGAWLASRLLEAGLVDQLRLSVMPVLLGDGIRLFPGGGTTASLHLQGTREENGVVELWYRRIAPGEGGPTEGEKKEEGE